MSIRVLDNSNIRVIELGQNTTGISQVLVDKSKMSSGIAFSNTLDGKLSDNGVIIQITSMLGVTAYIRAILGLLKTWDLDKNSKIIINGIELDLIKFMDKRKK